MGIRIIGDLGFMERWREKGDDELQGGGLRAMAVFVHDGSDGVMTVG